MPETPVPIVLTVVKLEADTVDATTVGGPPTQVIGGWVSLTATNGQITVTEKVLLTDAPTLGAAWTVFRPARPTGGDIETRSA